jgi:hypothetical protein
MLRLSVTTEIVSACSGAIGLLESMTEPAAWQHSFRTAAVLVGF